MLLSTYANLIDEYEGRERVDAEAEIAPARERASSAACRWRAPERVRGAILSVGEHSMSAVCPLAGVAEVAVAAAATHKPLDFAGSFSEYRYRDSNPGFRRERAAS